MEEIFNNINDYILILDENNIIRFYNKKLLEKLGYINEPSVIEERNINTYIKDNIIKLISISGEEVKFTFKIIEQIINKNILKVVILKEESIRGYNVEDLELVLDNSPLLTWIKDIYGRYIYANSAYANKFGISKSDIIGKTDRDFWDKKEALILESEDRNLVRTKSCFAEKEFLRIKNSQIWFYVFKSVALDDLGNVKYVFGMAKDITEKKGLEEKNKRLENHIVMENLKNEFLANISHEFKTPLNLIISTIQLLDEKIYNNTLDKNSKFEKYVKIIEKNSYRLLRIINNFIDITEVNSGNYDVNMKKHNIVYLVEKIIDSTIKYIDNENLTIIFDADEEEKIVLCDKDKIERIILNLLSNAIKAIEGKGNILVSIYSNDNGIEILVKDDGIGIKREKLDTIFDEFSRIDKSLTRKQEGSGLGLSLVRSLLDIQGGTISVNSELGEGTEFIINLPSKTIEEDSEEMYENSCENDYMELNKCIIEFSDIYCI